MPAGQPDPLISVVLPVYNGADWLEQAISSVLTQNFEDFELIIVDDGSIDRTPEIAKAFARNDQRIKLLMHEASRGCTAAINTGIRNARGSFIARMDADDVALPGRFARQIGVFDETADDRLAVVATCTEAIDSRGVPLPNHKINAAAGPITRDRLAVGNCLVHSSVLIRKSAVEAVGGYREAFRTSQDYDLWLRLSERYSIQLIPDVLLQYRIHDRSTSNADRLQQICDDLAIRASAIARASGRREPIGLDGSLDLDAAAALLGVPGDWNGLVANALRKRARNDLKSGRLGQARATARQALGIILRTRRQRGALANVSLLLRSAAPYLRAAIRRRSALHSS